MAAILGSGRPAESKNRIVEDFRSRIAMGELHPGSRFPTRSEIEQQYGAGTGTVQRALESLREEGFIRVNGRKGGTFVADNPPHLSRYAIVFCRDFSEQPQGQFWSAISRELEFVSGLRPECQLLPYYKVDGHEESEDFTRLCHEVLTHRIAGLIFTSHPYQLRNTPLLDEPNIPRVAIMAPAAYPFPLIVLDTNSFLTRALDYLREQGHRRVAFLNNTGAPPQPFVENLVAQRGMETRPYWFQNIDVTAPESAKSAHNCVHLLMNCREVPDALIICDDNLVEPATSGLIAAGEQVPAGFAVLAHTNFPYPTPALVPAKRLGFDIQQILKLCVDSIDTQRRGEPVLPVTSVAACFEDQLAISRR